MVPFRSRKRVRGNGLRSFLESHDVAISMSPKSLPCCNGSQEHFFVQVKAEFREFDRFVPKKAQ